MDVELAKITKPVEPEFNPDNLSHEEMMQKMWEKIYVMANVPLTGPNNRAERRRVERILRKLAENGLKVGR